MRILVETDDGMITVNSQVDLIVLELTEDEKKLISMMGDQTVFASFPDWHPARAKILNIMEEFKNES
jgi:hypothetical protein